jgi:hypothetical protein
LFDVDKQRKFDVCKTVVSLDNNRYHDTMKRGCWLTCKSLRLAKSRVCYNKNRRLRGASGELLRFYSLLRPVLVPARVFLIVICLDNSGIVKEGGSKRLKKELADETTTALGVR